MKKATLTLLLTLVGPFATAQTPTNPPAQPDREIIATVIAGILRPDQTACQAACKANADCTGYNFYVPGYTTRNQTLNCSLLKNPVVREEVSTGVVSCRMPCTAPLLGGQGKASVISPGVALRPPAVRPPPLSAQGRTAAPPPAAPPPAPAVPPAVGVGASNAARSGIQGHEVVLGPYASIPPLSMVTVHAQCPAGKVALSAGYEFTGSGDAAFGMEVHGAAPDRGAAEVTLRNANVAVAAQGRALAICSQPPQGFHRVQILRWNDFKPPCASDESLIGGGTYAAGSGESFWLAGNAPYQVDASTVAWQGYLSLATPWGPLDEPRRNNYTIALCAKTASIPGWVYLATPHASLGARAQTELSLSCPPGKVLLAAGHLQHARNDLDLVSNKLSLSRSGASARLMNRNIIGAAPVVTSLSMLCADGQP